MGLRRFAQLYWTFPLFSPRLACRLGVMLLLAIGFLPGRAAAQTGACPGVITANFTLSQNITAASGGQNPCIILGADNLTVNLGAYTIDVSNLGDSGVAISTGTTSNTTIVGNGGKIVTAYTDSGAVGTSAIEATGGTNLTITGVKVVNEPGGAPCTQGRTDENWGTGIKLDTVTGATVSGNSVSCFQTGISVQNSAIPRQGTGSISGNTLLYNIYDMNAAQQSGVYSAGLVLSNSSGWSVSGNTIEYNGSDDKNATCVSSPPAEISCSFGLQILLNSNNNSIQSNTVNSNYVGGIYTDPTTSKNTISGNTAQVNGIYDLYDDAPAHSNSWHHNTCNTVGGSLSSHTCH